jgi:hypothetical protein
LKIVDYYHLLTLLLNQLDEKLVIKKIFLLCCQLSLSFGQCSWGQILTVYGEHLDHYHVCDLQVRFGPMSIDQNSMTIGSKGEISF